MTAVETLRSRAEFAQNRGSTEYADHLNSIADKGEEAAEAEIQATRVIGKAIVIRADFKEALDGCIKDFADDTGISWTRLSMCWRRRSPRCAQSFGGTHDLRA